MAKLKYQQNAIIIMYTFYSTVLKKTVGTYYTKLDFLWDKFTHGKITMALQIPEHLPEKERNFFLYDKTLYV